MISVLFEPFAPKTHTQTHTVFYFCSIIVTSREMVAHTKDCSDQQSRALRVSQGLVYHKKDGNVTATHH